MMSLAGQMAAEFAEVSRCRRSMPLSLGRLLGVSRLSTAG